MLRFVAVPITQLNTDTDKDKTYQFLCKKATRTAYCPAIKKKHKQILDNIENYKCDIFIFQMEEDQENGSLVQTCKM